MLRLERSLHWGPFPFENTGGHVVQQLLLDKMHEKAPLHEFYAIPKNIELLDPKAMPYIQFFVGDKSMTNYLEYMGKYIPQIISKYHIPLLIPFHISYDVENLIDPVHDVGAKILMHQTVHFKTDLLFNCKRLNDVDWIATPTQFGKDVLSHIGKVSKTKMNVIPHGIDTKKYYPHDTPTKIFYREKKKTVILFSGRLSMWKGIHQIIPLFREFTKKYNCVFIIRGQPIQIEESSMLNVIMDTISKQNKNVVYLSEWLPQSTIENLFASADILISPTGSEGFNVPLIEAMACEVPVITTSLPNHVEILGEETGIFVKPKEIAGMADRQTELKVPTVDDLRGALKYLIENPEERKIMGRRGRERVLQNFDLENVIIPKWFKLFDTLIPENYSMESEIMRRMEKNET